MAWYDSLMGIESSSGKRDDFLEDRQDTADNYMGQADKFQNMSDQFFDPNSSINNSRFGILESAIQDNTASGIRDYQATMAQQGNNVSSSGIGAQNVLQARRRAGGDTANALNKAYQNSFGLGMSAGKMGMQNRQLGDNIYAGANQVKMQQDSINSSKKAGMKQMIAGAGLNMLMPGVGSLLGGAMAGKGTMMENFAKPYADSFNNDQQIQSNFTGLLNYAGNAYQNQSPSAVQSYGGYGSPYGGQPQMPAGFGGYSSFRLNQNPQQSLLEEEGVIE